MAKRNKISEESQENTIDQSPAEVAEIENVKEVEELIVLTEEQVALQEAIANNTLSELQASGTITEKLDMLITVYTSLLGVLGADSPATINAFKNLESYQPDKAKKAKKERGEPKFNEGRTIREIFGDEGLDDEGKLAAIKTLQVDERISEELKVAITTYVTLLGIESIPVQAVQLAQNALLGWGKKGKVKTSGNSTEIIKQAPYGIVVDGDESVVYKNRTEAVRSLGYDKDTFIGDSKISTELKAWQAITRGLHSEKGEATYEGHTFKRVDAESITE